MTSIVYPRSFPRTVLGVHPKTFDANRRPVQGPFVHIGRTSRGDRKLIRSQSLGQNRGRSWQYRSGATYVSELLQALPEGEAGRVESIENLL